MKRLIALVILLVLLVGILTVSLLIGRNQDLRKKAATKTASFTFNPQSIEVAEFSDFTIDLGIDTGGNNVVGVDVALTFDKGSLHLDRITLGNDGTSLKDFLPLGVDGTFDSLNVVDNANRTGKIEFGAVNFDNAEQKVLPVYNGSAPSFARLTFSAMEPTPSEIRVYYAGSGVSNDANIVLEPVSGTIVGEDVLAVPIQYVAVNVISLSPSPSPSSAPTVAPTKSPTPTPTKTPTPTPVTTATPTSTPIALGCSDVDFNSDGKVNILDYSFFFENFGKTSFDARADLNSDGKVNIIDYVLFFDLYRACP